jgi:hypothetical protein
MNRNDNDSIRFSEIPVNTLGGSLPRGDLPGPFLPLFVEICHLKKIEPFEVCMFLTALDFHDFIKKPP